MFNSWVRKILWRRDRLPTPVFLGFRYGSADKRIRPQCGRPGFNSWVGKIPWRRKWQPIPVFLPGKSHRQRSLAGYSPWGHKESDTTERLPPHIFMHRCMYYMCFPSGTSGKEPAQCRRLKRLRFDSWVGKVPWRRTWQPTPVLLPEESS